MEDGKLDMSDTSDIGLLDALTPAERSVLQAICECDGNVDSAADKLCLSLWTVRAHLQSIREKLGVHTTTEAAVLFAKNGLWRQ